MMGRKKQGGEKAKRKRMGRDYPSVLVGLNLGKKDLREPETGECEAAFWGWAYWSVTVIIYYGE
jgi:hypothetical protein